MSAAADTPIWRIGFEDNSGGEFGEGEPPREYAIPADWRSRRDWTAWPGRSSGAPPVGKVWKTDIAFDLESVPPGGAVFELKTLDAGGMVPEVAVFANGLPAGILQIVGAETPNHSNGRKYGDRYRIWIPSHFLERGGNTLRLEKLAPIHARDNFNRIYLDIWWDCLSLSGLAEPPPTPFHGRTVHLGVVYGSFSVDAARAEQVGKLWEWLGIAHSGNPIRASFWSNLPPQSHYRELLETAREYNMSVVLAHLTDKDSAKNPSGWIDARGELLPGKRAELMEAWEKWGDLIQYYELTNEPCMSITDASFAVDMALAETVRGTKPEHVILLGPGYAYGGGFGDPKNWSADAGYRRRLGVHTQAIGGHAYGRSYFKQPGGSLSETLDTWGEGDPPAVTEGFEREFIVTETGSHLVSHEDFANLGIGSHRSGKLRASIFDKVIRAHIGFADRILVFSAFGGQDAPFRMIDGERGDPSTWRATPFPASGKFEKEEVETKVGIFRRLALAYATHGAPIPYAYLDREAVEHRLVHVRAVDTRTLPPLAGSGATGGKLLLNFVNFSGDPQTLSVRFRLPESGNYRAVRFGAESTYAAARRETTLQAAPDLDLTEILGPYESVQYVLTPP